jgi:hypothetical protein
VDNRQPSRTRAEEKEGRASAAGVEVKDERGTMNAEFDMLKLQFTVHHSALAGLKSFGNSIPEEVSNLSRPSAVITPIN